MRIRLKRMLRSKTRRERYYVIFTDRLRKYWQRFNNICRFEAEVSAEHKSIVDFFDVLKAIHLFEFRMVVSVSSGIEIYNMNTKLGVLCKNFLNQFTDVTLGGFTDDEACRFVAHNK